MSRWGLAARCVLALWVAGLCVLVGQGLRRELPPVPEAPAARPSLPETAALAAALGPENPSQVRVWALELLKSVGGPARPEALALLRAALDDPDPAVRDAARRSLARQE